MADNQEEVVYSFEGDTSSLRQATQEAISLLDKFETAIKSTASKDTFSASKTSATNFQRSINGLVKQVNLLTSSLNTAGSAVETAMPDGAAIVAAATKDFADVLDYLSSSTTITSSDLKLLTEVLKETRNSIDPVIARAQLLSSSLKPLESLQAAQSFQSTGAAVQQTQRHFEAAAAAGFRVQDAYEQSGKSAAESAAVFLKASRSAEKITSIQGAVRALKTEMSLLGAQTRLAWEQFANKIDPTGAKIQSFKDRTNKAFGQIRATIAKVSGIFKRVSTESDKTDSSFKKLSSSTGKVGNAFKSMSNHAKTNHNALKMLSGATRGLKSAFQALIGLKFGSVFVEAAKQSISYVENLNLFKVAMGDALDIGTEFVDQMSEIYGMDPSNLMRYAGNFYQLADAIDMPDESAAKLSLSLVKASNDISSLFNVPIDQVFENLSSGMQGMSRAVRKYSMDIRTTTLQQTALSLGIKENVTTMSEANRQGLRFITMMKQASNASGDFARTIESPANQLKIFREQMGVLGRSIGNLFIKPLTVAMAYINGFVMALSAVINFIASIAGIFGSIFGGSTFDAAADSADGAAESIEGIGGAAGGAAKKLKQMLAPFDELNVLQDQQSSGGGGGGNLEDLGTLNPAIAEQIEKMELQLENIKMKAVEVRDALLEFLGFEAEEGTILSWDASAFEANLINKFPQWTQTIQAIFANWTSIVEAFGETLEALAGIAQAVWEKTVGFIGKFVNDDSVSTAINNMASSLSSFASYLRENQEGIANFVIILGALVSAFRGLSIISTLIGPVATFISTCTTALAPFANLLNWVTLVVAAIVVLYQNSTVFATAFDSLVASIGEGLVSVFASLWTLLQTIWVGIQTIWAENIQPMLVAVGEAVAPVIKTIEELWNNLAAVVSSAINSIEQLWTSTLEPVLAAFFDAISGLAEIFGTLWSEVIGPVVEHIGDGFQTLWETMLRPIFESIVNIIGDVIVIVLELWNNVLAPLINWLVNTLAPIFRNVFNTVWDIIQNVVGNIGQSIRGLLQILQGIIDFIAGVFTGNWSRAWEGIVGIFEGIWNTLAGIVKIVLNAVIGVLNVGLSAISGAINAIIRAVNTISFTAPDWVPGVGGKRLGFNLKEVGNWNIPYLESGAVVTSPTLAMVGEGKYDEAVIPLGNSPQMKELIDRISEATSSRGINDPIQVNVFIGNEQVAEYMHTATKRAQLQTNGGI